MVTVSQHKSIYILPDEVASKIAAGEVIERPSSVVRELVDNAIDAGASAVRVEIAGGGRTLIRVTDDGCGVRREEMPRAFLRHATSKLRTAEDLWAVRTLGFRGEALYSIAAVSKLTFTSRTHDAAGGYEMTVHGGEIVDASARGAPAGTCVTVRDLFYSLPARLAFLKSAPAEAANITALVQSYALAHPHVRFTLSNEGRATFASPGDGDLRSAAFSVYGSDTGRALLPVGVEPEFDVEGAELGVWGYCSPPVHSRSNRSAMHFFVNRRAIASRMLLYAVQEAYHSLLMVGRFPVSIIHVQLEPGLLDVNVHPAKSEVKFRDERAVFSAVQRAVRSALTAHVPPPDFGTRGTDGWSFGAGEPVHSGWSPTDTSQQTPLWEPVRSTPPDAPAEVEPLPRYGVPELSELRLVGQLGNTYIVAEGSHGLYLIDQHAAHERVLYEQNAAGLANGTTEVQPLLEPLSLEFDIAEWDSIEPLVPLMTEFGFELELFGERCLLLRAVPAIYSRAGRDVATDAREMLLEVGRGHAADRWREEMAITIACHSAVRAGQSLDLNEMRALLNGLARCRYPRSCAHGRPTMLHLSQAQLEREFGRRA